jgi:hypothetical protein
MGHVSNNILRDYYFLVRNEHYKGATASSFNSSGSSPLNLLARRVEVVSVNRVWVQGQPRDALSSSSVTQPANVIIISLVLSSLSTPLLYIFLYIWTSTLSRTNVKRDVKLPGWSTTIIKKKLSADLESLNLAECTRS